MSTLMDNFNELAVYIHRKTVENQGITINLERLEPTTGYMVGTSCNERRIKLSEFTPDDVYKFIKEKLGRLLFRQYFIGTWISNDTVYLDISHRFVNKEIAIIAGKQQHQICLWDLADQKEIYWLAEDDLQLLINHGVI